MLKISCEYRIIWYATKRFQLGYRDNCNFQKGIQTTFSNLFTEVRVENDYWQWLT